MKQIIVGVAAGLVLAYGVGYNQIYARQQRLVRLKKAEIVKQQANQKSSQDVAALLNELDSYSKKMAPEPDSSWLAKVVVAAGEKAGLQLTSIAQESPQKEKLFTRLAVNTEFHATYHQLGAFLDALEQSEHFIRIEKLNSNSATDGSDRSTVQVTLSTLYTEPAAKLVSADSGAGRAKKKEAKAAIKK